LAKLLKRKDVPVKYTWDLSLIFSSDKIWEEEFRLLAAKIPEKEQYEGTLKNGAHPFLDALEWQLYMIRTIQKIYFYALLKNSQDTKDANYQTLIGKAMSLYAKIAEAISWFEPEVLSLPDYLLTRYLEELPKLSLYQHYLEEITSQREHIRSAEVENVLASAIDVLKSSSDTFEKLIDSDLKFEDIENVDGNLVQLTHGNYTSFLEVTNRKVRKAAFESIYKSFEQFQHSFASTLNGEVKTHVFSARTRNYTGTREAALSGNQIPELVYDQLVTTVNQNLSLLHRYIALRKKTLKIDNLQPYDLYTPLLGEAPIKFTFEEAKEKILEALTPLGEDYIDNVKYIFKNRIIDVYENEGKRSGAFSSGMYDTEPYIL
jgi:oligoendopeptidase F